MAISEVFGKRSPFGERRDMVYGRPGGRPVGTTGQITGQVTPPGGALGGTGSGISGAMQQSPYASFLSKLAQPIPYKDQSQQRWNLARGREQAITKLQMEQGKTLLGGQGLTPGESGIADTAMGRIIQAGGERMSAASQQVAMTEADRQREYDMMNLQRQLGGAGLALTGEEGAQQRMMDYYRSKLGAETAEWQPWWSMPTSGY